MIRQADLRVAYRGLPRAEGRLEAAIGCLLDWLFWHRTGRYGDGVPLYRYRERRRGGWR